MKRTPYTYFAVFGLLSLLCILAVLQYNALRRISESDGEKAHKHAQEQADRFAADFNREIQGAYFNFQTDADNWKNRDWTGFNERYAYWREKTSYPDLISDFYFVPQADSPVLLYDRSSMIFVPVEETPTIIELRKRFADPNNFKPIQDDLYTLALPIHEADEKIPRIFVRTSDLEQKTVLRAPAWYGVLAIKLNEDTIKSRIIPDLQSKYFGEGDFRISVTAKGGRPITAAFGDGKADASSKLFDLSPENIIQYANKDILSNLDAERRTGNLVMNSQIERRTMSLSNTNSAGPETFQIELNRGDGPKTAIFTRSSSGDDPGWLLQIQHEAGSIDAYTASTFKRNLAVGSGLLVLLALAIGSIFYSGQRAKVLAQRQIDFVSSVSHELRTPLAVIYSAGENLADGVTKESGHVTRYGELIKSEGKKLSSMVEQILAFAGANSGHKKYSFRETTTIEIVNDALAECLPLLKSNAVEVETNLADAPLSGDMSALSAAVQNLIGNAVKYGNGRHWVRITASNGGAHVRISVEDRGIGISKKDLRQVFKPFYRSREVVDAQIHGNGLGLSLVEQIAEAHGGKVVAKSEPGKGSIFTIELPIMQL
ncbi:MAG: HAMP domain-containing sensor histidine kinase [Acidobacteriota bacterium]